MNIIKLLEILDRELGRKYHKKYPIQIKNRRRYDILFGKNKRVYLPISSTNMGEYIQQLTSKTKNTIEQIFNDNKDVVNFSLDSYKEGLAKERIVVQNYPPKDRFISIPKALDKLYSKKPEPIFQQAKKEFINDPFRDSDTDYSNIKFIIAVSRSPKDLLQMSTGRKWTSCMDLSKMDTPIIVNNREEHFTKHITHDIAEGTLIAYLISSDDKEIEDPLARLLIKPFLNNGETILYPEILLYGPDSKIKEPIAKIMKSVLLEWLKPFNDGKSEGQYELHPKLYNDGTPHVNFNVSAKTITKYVESIRNKSENIETFIDRNYEDHSGELQIDFKSFNTVRTDENRKEIFTILEKLHSLDAVEFDEPNLNLVSCNNIMKFNIEVFKLYGRTLNEVGFDVTTARLLNIFQRVISHNKSSSDIVNLLMNERVKPEDKVKIKTILSKFTNIVDISEILRYL